ncbi:MAG: 16S rRNA (guanine(527)-N(7))-methyltransferase RsmG [Clostridia bacterium]|nr:16S rRNA (guanine(527)-N(7))-methyltransferase RsmG [Clostridia bacterium]
MLIKKELLKSNAASLGVELGEDALEKFDMLAELLIEQNKTMNLTAITDPDEVVIKHFADSISLLSAINPEQNAKILDLGTGAGFPGIPLLITRPDIRLTMVDSTAKKLRYVADTVEKLGLEAETLHARAEEAGKNADYREQYDIVCSRAVAALNVLSEYCLPFVKVGGVFVAMKSAKAEEEIADAKKAIGILGGKIIDKKTFTLSDGGERTLIIIKKISQTSPKYPRVSAQISKKPL